MLPFWIKWSVFGFVGAWIVVSYVGVLPARQSLSVLLVVLPFILLALYFRRDLWRWWRAKADALAALFGHLIVTSVVFWFLGWSDYWGPYFATLLLLAAAGGGARLAFERNAEVAGRETGTLIAFYLGRVLLRRDHAQAAFSVLVAVSFMAFRIWIEPPGWPGFPVYFFESIIFGAFTAIVGADLVECGWDFAAPLPPPDDPTKPGDAKMAAMRTLKEEGIIDEG